MSLPVPILRAEDNVTITVPAGSTVTTPDPPGTLRVDLGVNGGMILINGVPLISAPAWSTVIRHPDGRTVVTVGGFTVIAPAGATISTPSPAGTLRVDLGATAGTININGANLATASAGVGVVFNTNNTTTAIVGSTSVTVPTTNGPTITDNGNGTITVILPGQAPITIPANGGNWFAVFFHSNGGGNVGAQIIESGASIVMPTTPSRTGFTFAGWYSDASLTNVWNFGADTVNAITTLFARWQVAYTPAPPTITPPTTEPMLEEPIEDTPTEYEPVEDEPTEETHLYEDEELPILEPYVEEDEPYEEYQEEYTEYEEESDVLVTDVANEVSEINESTDATDALPYTPQDEDVIIQFALANLGNPVNDSVSHARIINRAVGLQFLSGEIPAFVYGDGLVYTVRYRTNLNEMQHVIASNVPAGRPFTFLPPELADYEVITEISIEFDTIPAGFGIGNAIVYRFLVLDRDSTANYWHVAFGDASNRNYIIAAISNSINNVADFESRYDYESWRHLQTVIGYVQVVLDNPNATVAELEIAYVLLQQAIDELSPVEQTPPVALASIIAAVAMFALFSFLIFVVVKLLKYKKRVALGLSHL